jgi:hypothetical protein
MVKTPKGEVDSQFFSHPGFFGKNKVLIFAWIHHNTIIATRTVTEVEMEL